jgi:hypothetical protein
MWFWVSLQPGLRDHGHGRADGAGRVLTFQRLQIDQFPNIDFPWLWSPPRYPGASPGSSSRR